MKVYKIGDIRDKQGQHDANQSQRTHSPTNRLLTSVPFRLQMSVCLIMSVKASSWTMKLSSSVLANKCLHNPVSVRPSQLIMQPIQQQFWTMGAQKKEKNWSNVKRQSKRTSKRCNMCCCQVRTQPHDTKTKILRMLPRLRNPFLLDPSVVALTQAFPWKG